MSGTIGTRTWEHFDPHLPELIEDPRPAFAWLREHSPVHHVANEHIWVLSRYRDVWAAAREPDRFSNSMGVGYGRFRPPGDHPAITNMDQPHHTIVRQVVGSWFTPRAVHKRLGRARELMDESLDRTVGAGRVNFADEVSWPLIARTVAEMLDFPDEDLPMIRHNTDSAVMSGQTRDGRVLPWVYADPEEARKADPYDLPEARDQLMPDAGGYVGFAEYFATRVAARDQEFFAGRIDPDSPRVFGDLLYRRGKDGYELDFMEKVAFEGLMAIGGNETTTQQLSGSALLLAERPDVLDLVRDDPALTPSVVEELLRHVSAVNGLFRNTTTEVRIGDVTIPADEKVLLLYGSANHDPAHYDRPDEFVAGRFPRGMADADHLAFTNGAHVCLGANLARVLLTAFLERLAARVERIDLVGPVGRGTNALVRIIEDLPVELVPRRV